MSVNIFLSTVYDEFRPYRDALRHDLTRHNVEVKVQEDFKDLGGDTLDKLDVYIANCDAVIQPYRRYRRLRPWCSRFTRALRKASRS